MSGPPDKFEEFLQTEDPQADLDTMNQYADQGYTTFAGTLTYPGLGTYIVMGGYKGNGS